MKISNQLKSYIQNHQVELENNLFDRFAIDVLVKGGAYLFEEACELCLNEFGENLNLYIRNDYVVDDNVVFSRDKKMLYKYAPEKYDLKYVIPSTVETIHYEAFMDNHYLEDIEIPANVTHIGSRAFYNCNHLKQIKWAGAKTAGSEVFIGCQDLKTVICENMNDFWNYGCDNLGSPFINGADLYVNGTLCEEITVPNEVRGTFRAFKGCKSIKHINFDKNHPYIERALLYIIDSAERTNVF